MEVINPFWRAKKEPKLIRYCLECSGRMSNPLFDEPEKVCENPECEMFNIKVTDWYVFEEGE